MGPQHQGLELQILLLLQKLDEPTAYQQLQVVVQQQAGQLQAVVQQHGATALRAFGAVARGEDAPGTEIDLLVDHPDGAFDPTPLREALEGLIGVRVDLVALPPVAGPVREQLLARSMPL